MAANPVVVNPMPANPQQNYQEGYRIMVDLQNFFGSLDIESVLDWLAEVERFFEIMNVKEERKVPIVAYKGLNHEIRCMMGVAAIFTLADAIEMAKRAEERVDWQPRQQQYNRNFNYRNSGSTGTQQYRGNYSGQPSKVVNSGNPPNTMEERRDSKGKAVTTTTDKGGRTNPYQKPTGDICYRCRQSGHRSNNCPECRGVNTDRWQVNIVEQVAETDEEEDDDDGSIAGSKDGEVTYVVKKILCSTK
ncbi:hypothetical protein MANES_01G057601v8 [Manihot esculenta]|uniref:Uncharacterized protein n=1 Tax=Manihot esculenta TaxID=3983 RepID=A0ACB7IDR5_MANES|nr:hypothetical protein MANES_01G057601v8 [Manihot esculenta]